MTTEPGWFTPRNVLVSDDLDRYRKQVRRRLAPYNARIVDAATLEDLEAAQASVNWDMAILDRRLSGDTSKVDRVEDVAVALRHRNVLVVLLTAFPPEGAHKTRLDDAGVITITKGEDWHRQLDRVLEGTSLATAPAAQAPASNASEVAVGEQLLPRLKNLFVKYLRSLPQTVGEVMVWGERTLTVPDMIAAVERGEPEGAELLEAFVETLEYQLEPGANDEADSEPWDPK